jgi:hypothetical protein
MTGAADPAGLIDANLILWAHYPQFAQHDAARQWWARTLSTAEAWATVEGWLDRPNVWVPAPTERHRQLFAGVLIAGQASANHTTERWRDPLAQ